GAKFSEEIFVRGRERSIEVAIVISDDNPAAGLEDAAEFRSCAIWLEPVEGLTCGDEIDAGVTERGRFRGGVDAAESIVRGEVFLSGVAHLGVGLDAVDAIAVLQKEFTEEASAGADVGDHVASAQVAFRAKECDELGRVAGAIADVVGHAGGETLFGVGEGHGNWRRKRTSLWKKTWMSSMPYFNIARRSMPMP